MSLRFETAHLRAFAAGASKSAPAVAAQLRSGLREAGELVAASARAGSAWSTRIPASIKVSVRGPVARVSAGSAAAPHAAAYEHEGVGGTFRHPVNAWARHDRAEWVWANNPARPFLHPALADRADAAADIIAGSVEQGFLSVLP